MPLNKLAETYPKVAKMPIGTDLLEKKLIGAKKYEPPVKANINHSGGYKRIGFIKRLFTKSVNNKLFTKYMNMSHIQQKPDIFDDSDIVVATEKLHGTSFRFGMLQNKKSKLKMLFSFIPFFKPKPVYEFCYGSRNVQLQRKKKDGSVYQYIVDKYNLSELIKNYGDYEFFGEIVGPGIQTNYTYGLKPGTFELYMYDIKYKGEYVNYHIFADMCYNLGLKNVPVMRVGEWRFLKTENLNEGQSGINPGGDVLEGCVYQEIESGINAYGRKKCKHLNPEFLLNKLNSDNH